MGRRLDDVAACLAYGGRISWAVKVEGISTVFCEADGGASAPSGYGLSQTLIVDWSSKVGSVIDRQSGIGRGFDLTISLQDSDAARAFLTPPDHRAILAADLTATATTVTVDSTAGWPSSGTVSIGRETCSYTGTTATTFTGLTRWTHGKAYEHKAGSSVAVVATSAPQWHVGRRVTLYAVPIDPYGRAISSGLLDEAAEVWVGTISEPPYVDGLTVALACSPLDRLLDSSPVPPISGAASWSGDPAWTMGDATDETLMVLISDSVGSALDQMMPFASASPTGVYHASELRDMIIDALNASSLLAVPAKAFAWAEVKPGEWRLRALVRSGYTDVSTTAVLGASGFGFGTTADEMVPSSGTGGTDFWVQSQLFHRVASGASLDVRLDSGSPADVPSSGWVTVEGMPGGTAVYRYTEATEGGDPGVITLMLDPDTRPDDAAIASVAHGGDMPDLTATIAYRDSGPVADVMRRLLMSSGRGDNDATYDTLDAGLDLELVDTASFGRLGGLYATLAADVAIGDEVTFADLFGGLLALGRRAVVARHDDDGTVVLAVVHAGLTSTAPAVDTINAAVIAGSKAEPVRPMRQWQIPATVRVSVLDRAGDEASTIVVSDPDRAAGEPGRTWELATTGIPRAQLVRPALAWGQAMIGVGQHAQAVEVDVIPTVRAEPGDIVHVDVQHWALFQRSTGKRGYTGRARVLGAVTDLRTGVRTLTLLLGAMVDSVAWAPSAPIDSWDGTASAPTAIYVPQSYVDTLAAQLGSASTMTVWLYLPGADTAGGATAIVSAVTDTGTACKLTLASMSGSFTLTTSWRVACPDTASGNAEQDGYAHDGAGQVWS